MKQDEPQNTKKNNDRELKLLQVQEELLKVIPKGKENALHLFDLQRLTGMGAREVKNNIHVMRENGMPILSSSVGYWQAGSEADRQEFIDMMKSQALSRLHIIQRIKKGVSTDGTQEKAV